MQAKRLLLRQQYCSGVLRRSVDPPCLACLLLGVTAANFWRLRTTASGSAARAGCQHRRAKSADHQPVANGQWDYAQLRGARRLTRAPQKRSHCAFLPLRILLIA